LHAEHKCVSGMRLNFIAKAQEENHKSRLKSFGLAAEGSEVETFEHLENFPSPREQKSSGGGATTTVRSVARRDLDRQIGIQDEE